MRVMQVFPGQLDRPVKRNADPNSQDLRLCLSIASGHLLTSKRDVTQTVAKIIPSSQTELLSAGRGSNTGEWQSLSTSVTSPHNEAAIVPIG